MKLLLNPSSSFGGVSSAYDCVSAASDFCTHTNMYTNNVNYEFLLTLLCSLISVFVLSTWQTVSFLTISLSRYTAVSGRFGPIPVRIPGHFGPIPFRSGRFGLCRFGPISGVIVSAQFWRVVSEQFILYRYLRFKRFSG